MKTEKLLSMVQTVKTGPGTLANFSIGLHGELGRAPAIITVSMGSIEVCACILSGSVSYSDS